MSSISSVSSSAGLSDLMRMLSASAPPAVSSLLSSTNVQTALAKASPADIVQLSDQAMQLQMVSGLFGGSFGGAEAASQTSDANDMMASLFGSILSQSSPTAVATAQETTNLSMANLLGAIYSSSGTPSGNGGSSGDSGSLINLLA